MDSFQTKDVSSADITSPSTVDDDLLALEKARNQMNETGTNTDMNTRNLEIIHHEDISDNEETAPKKKLCCSCGRKKYKKRNTSKNTTENNQNKKCSIM